MDIGVEAAGFETLAAVELDPHAVETLQQRVARENLRTRVFRADIRTLKPRDLAPPGIDLLYGGPPCQAFSGIGKRQSLNDERGLLLFEVARFAKELAPRAILLEQVKGLLSAPDLSGKKGGAFERFLKDLGELGYIPKYNVLCAADYGVPQLRERLFLVATAGRNGFVFPPPTHSEDPESTPLFTLKPYLSVGSVLKGLPSPVPRGAVPEFPNHIDCTPERDRERIHPVPEGSFLASQTHVSKQIRRNLTKKDTTKYRRLHRSEPSLTLRCGEIFFHPVEDRYLTPREYMRIHGYPDSHILFGPVRSRAGVVRVLDQHRLVANSVPPPLARVIAQNIAAILN